MPLCWLLSTLVQPRHATANNYHAYFSMSAKGHQVDFARHVQLGKGGKLSHAF